MGSQASKGGVAVEGKAAAADPAAVKTNGQVGTGSSVTTMLLWRHTHIEANRASVSVSLLVCKWEKYARTMVVLNGYFTADGCNGLLCYLQINPSCALL